MSTTSSREATAAKFRPPTTGRTSPAPAAAPAAEVIDDPQVPSVLRKAPAVTTDKVRRTVDLSDTEHRETLDLQRDIAFTLGVRPHVISNDMLSRLLHKLARTDEATVRKLLGLIRAELAQREGER